MKHVHVVLVIFLIAIYQIFDKSKKEEIDLAQFEGTVHHCGEVDCESGSSCSIRCERQLFTSYLHSGSRER